MVSTPGQRTIAFDIDCAGRYGIRHAHRGRPLLVDALLRRRPIQERAEFPGRIQQHAGVDRRHVFGGLYVSRSSSHPWPIAHTDMASQIPSRSCSWPASPSPATANTRPLTAPSTASTPGSSSSTRWPASSPAPSCPRSRPSASTSTPPSSSPPSSPSPSVASRAASPSTRAPTSTAMSIT